MGQVAHIVSVAQPDAVAQVVGDDAVPVVVEADIARQQHRVAPADDALLGDPRRLPPDQRSQLHQLHHARWQDGGMAQVHEELQRPRGIAGPRPKRRVDMRAPGHGAIHHGVGRRAVPGLGCDWPAPQAQHHAQREPRHPD